MPVAMLAVLKTGGTIVAMNASQPEQRLNNIATQTKTRFVLISIKNSNLVKAFSTHIVIINNETIQTYKDYHDLRTILCVIFTFESTETLKRVMLNHINFSFATKHHSKEFEFKRESRMLDFASYSFDVSINNILLTFLTSDCVCVSSEKKRVNDIEDVMKRMKVNLMHITSTVSRLINSSVIPFIDLLMLGEEQLNASDVTQ